MFKSKTLFIVGAGASCEVGFPDSANLKNEISRLVNITFRDGHQQPPGDSEITEALRHIAKGPDGRSGDINPYLHASWKIRDAMSLAISIDNFLHFHQDNQEIKTCGKLAIVKAILEAERKSQVYVEDDRTLERFNGLPKSWFNKFFSMLHVNVTQDNLDSIFENISFIIFNYDRCIEQYLENAMKIYFAIPSNKAQSLLQKLKIYHPYGSVGRLSWQAETGNNNSIKFGAKLDPGQLISVSNRIKTFTERLEDQETVEALKREVAEAEVIVFLGFAFHDQNLQLIEPHGELEVKRIFATTYGFSQGDTNVIQDKLSLILRRSRQFFFMEGKKCNDFLDEYKLRLLDGK